MEGISVLNLELPESVKGVTVIKNENEYCIILNSLYDEKTRNEFMREELNKIKFMEIGV